MIAEMHPYEQTIELQHRNYQIVNLNIGLIF